MANVMDFTCDDYPEDLIRSIFEHQHHLAEKYIPIEKSNGLCLYDQLPADIDNAKAQARIKDMSWRATEEVAEAFEALENGEMTHFQEELADALHFLVEKYLICDFLPVVPGVDTTFLQQSMTPTYLENFFIESPHCVLDEVDNVEKLQVYMARFITASGLSCNCLKNKPWKQSQMMTDEKKFRRLLNEEFTSFINLCSASGYNARTLYDMYIRKNQVNQFRQRSNY